MRFFSKVSFLSLAALFAIFGVLNASPLHHDLKVRLDPVTHQLSVQDTISGLKTLKPDAEGGYRFLLHAKLNPRVDGSNCRLKALPGKVPADFLGINATTENLPEGLEVEAYRLIPKAEMPDRISLSFGGEINHPLAQQGEEYQRSFSETPGIISPKGVFLSGTSFWVPTFAEELVSFDLEVDELPQGWEIISQGRRSIHEKTEQGLRVQWKMKFPSEEIYLVGGPLTEYRDQQGETEVFAFLRTPDEGLARRYLEATKRYLRMYESILPAYPFPSFALVENFWETGYGMPGFTLLGQKIIRFPWILTSSYPHELLHNWWGNSVYVDFSTGNWCEGLTAYMADHMLAEQRGEGALYRRTTLKKFTDLVNPKNDFPLTEFHNRYSGASEAIGYGKALMLFHMMRRIVGDEEFRRALTRFDQDFRFQRASFADLAASFFHIGGPVLAPFVKEWTTRTGAPEIKLHDPKVLETKDPKHPYMLSLKLSQEGGNGKAYPLEIPIAVTLKGADKALWHIQKTCGLQCTVEIPCPSRPIRVDVDPEFDLMRRLDPLEVPPAISTLMGAKTPLFVLPSRASEGERSAWKKLATTWAAPEAPRIKLDSEIEALPSSPAWVLGARNRFAGEIIWRLEAQGVHGTTGHLIIGEDSFDSSGNSVVLISRDPKNPSMAAGLITAGPAEAIPALTRKLPHYQKYSYLAFKTGEATNILKGMWTPVGSPLTANLTEGPMPKLKLENRAALAEMPPVFQAADFEKTTRFLADPALKGRGLGSDGLARATEWVENKMSEIGLHPAGEEGFRQGWTIEAGEPKREMKLVNLLGQIPGKDPSLAPLVVTAHLDHLGLGWPDVRKGNEGKIHPGADDNASGVAVLLELARAMKMEGPKLRPILFAVVTGEEAGLLGSRHLVASLKNRAFADINIDTVGRLSEGAVYILNSDSAREWPFIFMGAGYTTGAPVKIVSEPLDASDQGSFLEQGIPAVQLFTGPTPDYHRPTDTVDKLDFEGMGKVCEVAKEAAAYLADRKESLHVLLKTKNPAETPTESPKATERKVSLGTMPDFGYSGPGVSVQAVMPGSAAEKCGLQKGDTLLAMNGQELSGLRDLSNVLKEHQPGDEVTLKVERKGTILQLKAVLQER